MSVSGGNRFLPIFGLSGSGKSSAARELASHLEGVKVLELSRDAIASKDLLLASIEEAWGVRNHPDVIVAIVDQYEETVAETASIPGEFVERISLMDRNELRERPVIFLWLTTSSDFQASLAAATQRNRRMLIDADFALEGPDRAGWAEIIEETFEFHNGGKALADEGILRGDIDEIADASETIGETMLKVGRELGSSLPGLHDLSQYQVLMLWPVADAVGITRIHQFTHPRDGYRLNWNSFWRDLTNFDKSTLPLGAYNRARLHFDVRLVPIAVADLHQLGADLAAFEPSISRSYLERLQGTHFYSLLTEAWDEDSFTPMRERASQRADRAREWYATVTGDPVGIGRRLAHALRLSGLTARHEVDLQSENGAVRADVFVEREESEQPLVIVELKAYSQANTMPSTIRDQIKTTLRRHAQFAGFMPRS
ncbi:hypothetical protein [Microbacterium oxydans]|uniref:hypothetical protein n=1 Tax=Microbacterium oxydans TaxID=82380 RepID=UPI00366CBC6B